MNNTWYCERCGHISLSVLIKEAEMWYCHKTAEWSPFRGNFCAWQLCWKQHSPETSTCRFQLRRPRTAQLYPVTNSILTTLWCRNNSGLLANSTVSVPWNRVEGTLLSHRFKMASQEWQPVKFKICGPVRVILKSLFSNAFSHCQTREMIPRNPNQR